MTSDKKPYGPWKYRELIHQCAIISRNFNTSYIDVRDKMTPIEVNELINLLIQEKEENEERARKFREERARAREQAKNNRSSR